MTDKEDLQDIGEIEDLKPGSIINTPITSEMKKAYLDYAMSVIVSRALPDIRDGLKPVQRRIVYAANDMGMGPDSGYNKSAALVGEVIGKYHPHGDTSIYDALVRMAQNFSLRYPLIDGQGNFGDNDGSGAAAMRYTECRLEKISANILRDIDKETVEFVDNYSAKYIEPTVLPSVMPNLLMNGAIGIAVGMATSIPPHNLRELIEAFNLLLDGGKLQKSETEKHKMTIYDVVDLEVDVTKWSLDNNLTIEDIYKVLPGPDFPTGCTIFDKSETLRYFGTGKGRIIQQAKAKIVEGKRGKYSIVVSEIPYMTTRSAIVEKIADLVSNKKIKEISEIIDASSGEDIEIIIELKREARPQKVLNFLYKYTPLQTAFNANMLALVNGQPQTIGIKQYLDEFIAHRQLIIRRRTLYQLRKLLERQHILQGLKKALDFIDEVIKIIRGSADTDVAREKLIKRFELTEVQAQAILDMQLKRLAALEREKIENELEEIDKNISKMNAILAKPTEMIKVIRKELNDIGEKFGDDRKTKVVKGKIGEFNEEDLIANEETMILITETGYIKRLKPSTYKTQSRGGKGVTGMKLKDEDEIALINLADTHDRILFITDKGRIYEQKVWDIPEGSRQSKGTAIVNILDISSEEKLEQAITVNKEMDENADDYYLVFATKNGNVKKTKLKDFASLRRTGIIAIGLKNDDQVVNASLTNGKNELLITTSKGKSIKFKESDVREMGRSAGGVRGIKIKPDDYVVGMSVITPKTENAKLFVVMRNGFGKSTKLNEYNLQNRGGSGIKAARVTSKTGEIVSAKIITDNTKDIIITSESGQVIRIPSKSIPISSRDTQGATLIRLNPEDNVSAVSVIDEHDLENGETKIENGKDSQNDDNDSTKNNSKNGKTGKTNKK